MLNKKQENLYSGCILCIIIIWNLDQMPSCWIANSATGKLQWEHACAHYILPYIVIYNYSQAIIETTKILCGQFNWCLVYNLPTFRLDALVILRDNLQTYALRMIRASSQNVGKLYTEHQVVHKESSLFLYSYCNWEGCHFTCSYNIIAAHGHGIIYKPRDCTCLNWSTSLDNMKSSLVQLMHLLHAWIYAQVVL